MPAEQSTMPRGVDTDLYLEIQQFYAAQMQALDGGDATGWAETFTEDGVFAANADSSATCGRAAIAQAAHAAAARLAEEGLVQRHWLGMLDARPGPDGGVRVRYYALVIRTPGGGDPVIWRSCAGADELVRHDGGWLVRERRITRDDVG